MLQTNKKIKFNLIYESAAKGSLKNNFTFWTPMHPDWLRYENSKYA
jgi:hypothetical protein